MSSAEIFAVGDVYLDRSSHDAPWGDLGPEMTRADATLCNYEAPISDRGTVARGRAVPLRTPAHLLGPIRDGWSAVSLAQNHALDWGEKAALDTLDLCATAGVHPHDARHASPELLSHLERVGRAPEVAAIGTIDQLSIDPQPITHFADAPF